MTRGNFCECPFDNVSNEPLVSAGLDLAGVIESKVADVKDGIDANDASITAHINKEPSIVAEKEKSS